MARRHKRAVLAGKRTVVHHKEHRNRRSVDINDGTRLRVVRVGESVTDLNVIDARHRADVTGARFTGWHAPQLVEQEELFHRRRTLASASADQHFLTDLDDALIDAPDANATNVVAVVESGDLQLQITLL